MKNQGTNIPSEGEVFLAEYFKGEGISFTPEKKIIGLKGDTKSFRKADFYLDKFAIYVEFYGMWNNSKEDRERYRKKKNIYYENRIPCVYIYPENLGIIEFSFPRRAIQEFMRHNMTKQLLRFRLKYLWLYKQGNIVYMLFAAFLLAFGKFSGENDSAILIVFMGIIIYQTYNILNWYRRSLIV